MRTHILYGLVFFNSNFKCSSPMTTIFYFILTVRMYNCSSNAKHRGLYVNNNAGNDMMSWVIHSVIRMCVISSWGELGTQPTCVSSSTGVLRNIFCRTTKLEGIRTCSS